jgi:hypothetical protein
MGNLKHKIGDIVLVKNVEEGTGDGFITENHIHPILIGTVIAVEISDCRCLVKFNEFKRSSWFKLDRITPASEAAKVLYGYKT